MDQPAPIGIHIIEQWENGRYVVCLTSGVESMSDPTLPPATNESYEIKRVQMEAAGCIAAFMHQLGAKYAPRRPHAWEPRCLLGASFSSDRWRKDAQVIDFHHDSHDHRKSEVNCVL